jgi:hypothetical protein
MLEMTAKGRPRQTGAASDLPLPKLLRHQLAACGAYQDTILMWSIVERWVGGEDAWPAGWSRIHC